jgi:hypothetical protein
MIDWPAMFVYRRVKIHGFPKRISVGVSNKFDNIDPGRYGLED